MTSVGFIGSHQVTPTTPSEVIKVIKSSPQADPEMTQMTSGDVAKVIKSFRAAPEMISGASSEVI